MLTNRPLQLCCLILTTGLFVITCEFSDNDLYSGLGSISGTVEINGQPVEGAQVNWVGAAFDSPPVVTNQHGWFLLDEVEAGAREIMIRAVDQEKGLRTAPVTVVDGQTSSIGRVQLEDAPQLPVVLLDPELGIGNSVVHLTEIPGVEAVTNHDGIARISCVPRSRCYSPVTRHEIYTFTFAPPPCPETAQEWSAGLVLYPDESQPWNHQQIHHAQVKIDKDYQEAVKCEQTCEFADWWQRPPCGLPVGQEQVNPDGYRDLKYTIASLLDSDRYNDIALNCPQIDDSMFSCENGLCKTFLPKYHFTDGL
ncbi:MAG: carboxypeptidase regulatory-like domain-containing protein, partial [Deltaproteobacteria bacterium]|nr:carboxypeptidase regulatory-like domain-containing protein [Deltaproteobacteria bacterium]